MKTKFKLATAILISTFCLLLSAFSQATPAQPHTTFFDAVTGYFSSYNTNYEGVLDTHKGTLWVGQDWQNGAHASTSLGLEYIAFKNFNLDSETRFSDISGNVKSQQLGLGYNVTVHDVRLTGFLAGAYDFETDDAKPVLGLRAKKLLTDHTFAFVGFSVPIEKQSHPRFEIGTGFVF